MNKRVFGFDLAKCVSIYLVILIHFAYYVPLIENTPLNNFFVILFNISVPLFFMVNGALLFSKSFTLKSHIQKTLRIICLVLVWKVLSALIMGMIEGISPFSGGKAAFLNYVLFGNLDGFMLGHFWFMNALIMLYLIFPILRICFDSETGKSSLVFLVVLVFGLTVVTNLFDTISSIASYYLGTPSLSFSGSLSQVNPFGVYGYTLVYFIGGGLIYHRNLNAPQSNELMNRTHSSARPLILFCIGWLALFLVQRFQWESRSVVFNVESGYWNIATVIMTFSAFLFLMRLQRPAAELICNLVETIGNNTLGIYLTHMFILMACSDWAASLNCKLSLPIDLLLVAAICFICLALSLLCKKIPIVRMLFKL